MAMTLRLTPEQTEALRKAAEVEGRSMQAVALAAIDEYTSRRTRRRDGLIDEFMAERADLLARLADA
ncbi:MAG: type II toxin -antitoxin system TacA 1-like antitoxin [Marmoricola sp.]